MNLQLFLFITLSAFFMLMGPITIRAQNFELGEKISAASKNYNIQPLDNPPPLPPTPPYGPIWLPVTREPFRFNSEQYRLKLEAFRQNDQTVGSSDYIRGIEQYKKGIESYRESILYTPADLER